jgi:hypothetical protein
MNADVKNDLNELEKSLKKIRAFVEWIRLKRLENRSSNPFLQPQDDTVFDMELEIWHFLSLLNQLKKQHPQDIAIQRQLDRLLKDFHQIQLGIAL